MDSDQPKYQIRLILAGTISCLAVALGACGSDTAGSSGDPGSADPASKLTEAQATAPLSGAPPELVSIRKQANQVLEEGDGALQQRLDSLATAGIPVVVNKWASWCGPCRQEFPDFQEQAKKHASEVAFIGINSNDGPDTAKTFLSELPVPYPSYSDPDQKIAGSLDIQREFPTTVFIDSSGKVTYTKRGPFADAGELDSDIAQYAN